MAGPVKSMVNIHEAKTHLSRIVEEVATGREVVIAKAGKPIARIVPLEGAKPKHRFGLLAGRIWVADDFDAPLPNDVLRDFGIDPEPVAPAASPDPGPASRPDPASGPEIE